MKFLLPLTVLLCGCASMGNKGPNQFFVERMWVRNTLAKEHLGSRRENRFSPVIAESLIIQGNAIDGLVAYDVVSANARWRLAIPNGVDTEALLIGNDLLFGASDGNFYSVEAQTGKVNWKYPIQAEGLGKPFAEGPNVYFVAGNNVLHAVEIASGRGIWVYTRRDAQNLSIRGGSQPNVVGDLVLAGFSDGFLVAVKKATGAMVWETSLNRNKRFRDVDAHPVIVADKTYISSYDGALYCLTWKDGSIQWSVEDGGESAVVLDDNRLYYSTSSGKTLSLDRNSGKILWTHINPDGIAVEPVIYKKMVVVGQMNGPLLFLDQNSGQRVTDFHPGWGVSSKPLIDMEKNNLYFMSKGENLFALRLAWRKSAKTWPWDVR